MNNAARSGAIDTKEGGREERKKGGAKRAVDQPKNTRGTRGQESGNLPRCERQKGRDPGEEISQSDLLSQ